MATAAALFDAIYAEAERASCCVMRATLSTLRPAAPNPATIEIPEFLQPPARIGRQVMIGADQFGLATACVEAFSEFRAEINSAARMRGMIRKRGADHDAEDALPPEKCPACGDDVCGYYQPGMPFIPGLTRLPSVMVAVIAVAEGPDGTDADSDDTD